MFKKIVSIALGLWVATSAYGKEEIQTINTENSRVEWKGSKVIGGTHNGTVKVKSGQVTLDGETLKKAEVIVDLSTIVDLDLTDPKWNQKLVGHLKSEDFFHIEKFPTARLEITEAKNSGNKYEMKGNLTIKDQTQPITLSATVSKEKGIRVVETSFSIDRTLWGLKYGSGKFFKDLGDKMISDTIDFRTIMYVIPEGKKTAQR